MYRKDYIQRQFEEFGKMLALILGYKHEKDWEKFEKEIANAVSQFTSLEVDRLETMSDEAFDQEIINTTTLSQNQKKILASLLFEKLSFYLNGNDAQKSELLKTRCMKLYQHVQDNFTENQFDLDTHYKLSFLKNL